MILYESKGHRSCFSELGSAQEAWASLADGSFLPPSWSLEPRSEVFQYWGPVRGSSSLATKGAIFALFFHLTEMEIHLQEVYQEMLLWVTPVRVWGKQASSQGEVKGLNQSHRELWNLTGHLKIFQMRQRAKSFAPRFISFWIRATPKEGL